MVSGLAQAGIEIVLRFFPLHLLPEWRDRPGTRAMCPTAERVWFRDCQSPVLSRAHRRADRLHGRGGQTGEC